MINLNEVSFEQGTIYFAYHKNLQWPANGGLRVLCYESTDAAKQEAVDLARVMCRKHENYQTGFQGGKIVAAVNRVSEANLKRVAEVVAAHLNKMNGNFITGCDLNFGERHAEFLAEKTDHVLAGLQSNIHYALATASGVVGAVKASLDQLQLPVGHVPRVLVHGSGAVGSRVASKLAAMGLDVMTYDHDHDKADIPGVTNVSRVTSWYATPMDILVMASVSRVIDQSLLDTLPAKAIVCAANLPFTDDGVSDCARERVFLVDESIASAGAVIADSIEYYAADLWQQCDPDHVYTFIEDLVYRRSKGGDIHSESTRNEPAGRQFANAYESYCQQGLNG